MNRWLWLCPALAVLLAAGILMAWGFSWWTAGLAALLLVCPAVLIWGVIETRRKRPRSDQSDRRPSPTDQ